MKEIFKHFSIFTATAILSSSALSSFAGDIGVGDKSSVELSEIQKIRPETPKPPLSHNAASSNNNQIPSPETKLMQPKPSGMPDTNQAKFNSMSDAEKLKFANNKVQSSSDMPEFAKRKFMSMSDAEKLKFANERIASRGTKTPQEPANTAPKSVLVKPAGALGIQQPPISNNNIGPQATPTSNQGISMSQQQSPKSNSKTKK
jgi:hypothetical protein